MQPAKLHDSAEPSGKMKVHAVKVHDQVPPADVAVHPETLHDPVSPGTFAGTVVGAGVGIVVGTEVRGEARTAGGEATVPLWLGSPAGGTGLGTAMQPMPEQALGVDTGVAGTTSRALGATGADGLAWGTRAWWAVVGGPGFTRDRAAGCAPGWVSG